jgi:polar amino acid transport system substrate-binding protein
MIKQWIWRYRIGILASITSVAVLFTYWLVTYPGARKDPTWHRVEVNHDLYAGLDPNYPPFAQWTEDDIEGLEVDIAREIGRRLGVNKTDIWPMGPDDLYDALHTGSVDFIISGLQVDPGMGDWVYYTQPYFDAGQVLVSRQDTPVQSMRDLDGHILAVEIASSGDSAAQRWERRLHSLTIRRCLLPDEAMQAVENGEANAALVDTISARRYVKDHPNLVIARQTTVSENYVIALRGKDFRFAEEVEQALRDMKKDGTLDEIIARWL